MYDGTPQAEALALIAAKMRSALAIEGDLPEEGLAALEGDGTDVLLALARRLTREAPQVQSLEALVAQARDHELEAEDYLVEGEWEPIVDRAPPEPQRLPGGDAGDLCQRVFNGEAEAADVPLAGSTGRALTLDELAQLAPRPRSRPRPVPEGQLALSGA